MNHISESGFLLRSHLYHLWLSLLHILRRTSETSLVALLPSSFVYSFCSECILYGKETYQRRFSSFPFPHYSKEQYLPGHFSQTPPHKGAQSTSAVF